MTNKFKSAALAATAVLTIGLGSTAANATTQSGNATANIVSAITITQDATLNFGTIVPAASGDTVVIDTANGKTCGATLTCSGASVSGAFHANGTSGQAVSISTDAGTSLTSGVNSMTVTGIAPSIASGTLALVAGVGRIDFTVGGTLNVGASQAAGVYNGNYNVTVNYN